jgi:hypothetical protein
MERFTIDGMMARLEEIYDDLLARENAVEGRGRHGEK